MRSHLKHILTLQTLVHPRSVTAASPIAANRQADTAPPHELAHARSPALPSLLLHGHKTGSYSSHSAIMAAARYVAGPGWRGKRVDGAGGRWSRARECARFARTSPRSAAAAAATALGIMSSSLSKEWPLAPIQLRQAGAYRHLSSNLQPGEQREAEKEAKVEGSTAATKDDKIGSKAKPTPSKPKSQPLDDDGSVRAARNTYNRTVWRRKKLEKAEASAEELAEADAAVRAGRAFLKSRLEDPANAEEKEAYLEKDREAHQRSRAGLTRGVSLEPPPHDHRSFPLNKRDSAPDDGSIASAQQARERAYRRLLKARKSSTGAHTLALLEQAWEATKEEYKLRVSDSRNTEEAEAKRANRNAQQQRYRAK